MQKRLSYAAKHTFLQCKTGVFGTRSNRFRNVLVMWLLRNRFLYEKYLHLSAFLSAFRSGQKTTDG